MLLILFASWAYLLASGFKDLLHSMSMSRNSCCSYEQSLTLDVNLLDAILLYPSLGPAVTTYNKLMEFVRIDQKCNLSKDLAQDRLERQNKILVFDPNVVGIRLWWWRRHSISVSEVEYIYLFSSMLSSAMHFHNKWDILFWRYSPQIYSYCINPISIWSEKFEKKMILHVPWF